MQIHRGNACINCTKPKINFMHFIPDFSFYIVIFPIFMRFFGMMSQCFPRNIRQNKAGISGFCDMHIVNIQHFNIFSRHMPILFLLLFRYTREYQKLSLLDRKLQWRMLTPQYEQRTSRRRLCQHRQTCGAAAWRPVVMRSIPQHGSWSREPFYII